VAHKAQLVVNRPGGRHGLAALALASVIKHDGSTATVPVSRQQLGWAITLLSPAEQCPGISHPNLEAWRALLDSGQSDFQAVFIRSLEDPASSAYDCSFRESLNS